MRRLTSTPPDTPVVKTVAQKSWSEFAELSNGKATINHRKKLHQTLDDLRSILEDGQSTQGGGMRDLKLIEIGSYAVGSSTPSSDLDGLVIPFASDETYHRLNDFQKKMEDIRFRKENLSWSFLRPANWIDGDSLLI
ncbi:hypothetical protein PMAYCL1PPCAC_13907 [Pristionchus mayeri]|uniref:Uncharacterized protein n=1 Tax=Pristionchus mayeri TaxID=1317129 RepID=A0AAN5CGN3_9BILA|nr:hypothetical protein PMAYCL1PPCAC_13907 [Pristionchus mayeri]